MVALVPWLATNTPTQFTSFLSTGSSIIDTTAYTPTTQNLNGSIVLPYGTTTGVLEICDPFCSLKTNTGDKIFPTAVNYDTDLTGGTVTRLEFTIDSATTSGTVTLNEQELFNWILQQNQYSKRQRLSTQHRHKRSLRGKPSFNDKLSPQEVKALQLLRQLVTPENFRKYLKYGFVAVRGNMSGLLYNVYRLSNTRVFDGQTEIASLCVHLKGNQPPTDEVIAKVLMVECNEMDIWQRSNQYWRNRTPKAQKYGFEKARAA